LRYGAPVLLTASNDLVIFPSTGASATLDYSIWKFAVASTTWEQLTDTFTDKIWGYSQAPPNPSANPLYILSQTIAGAYQVSSVDPTSFTVTNVASSTEMLPILGISTAALSDTFFIFGGADANESTHNDIYLYKKGSTNITLETPTNSSNRPVGRAYAAAVGYKNGFFVHGGIDRITSFSVLSDLWYYDLGLKSWKFIANVFPAAIHTGVISYLNSDTNNELLFFFGGIISSSNNSSFVPSNTTVKVDLSAGNAVEFLELTSLPSPRSYPSMSAVGNRVFLYGGQAAETNYGDVWQLVNEQFCKSAGGCSKCLGYSGCGFCSSNSQPFQCVAGNSTNVYILGTCSSSTTLLSSCPTEELLPLWAIIVIAVGGGLLVIAVIVFAVTKFCGRRPEYSSIES